MVLIVATFDQLLSEAHKTKGWQWAHDTPLWISWSLARFSKKKSLHISVNSLDELFLQPWISQRYCHHISDHFTSTLIWWTSYECTQASHLKARQRSSQDGYDRVTLKTPVGTPTGKVCVPRTYMAGTQMVIELQVYGRNKTRLRMTIRPSSD